MSKVINERTQRMLPMTTKTKIDEGRVIRTAQLDFTLGDKLAHLLVVEQQWSPIKTAVIATSFAWALSLIIAISTGTLLPDSGRIALLEDVVYIVTETILMPTIWGYYIWINQSPRRVLEKLEKADVLDLNDNQYKALEEALQNRMTRSLAAILALITAILYYFTLMAAPKMWLNANPFLLGLRVILVILPGAYVLWSVVIRIFVNAQLFRMALTSVVLHPLHPDRAAGLHPLGRYALKTTYLVAILGALGAILEYQAYIDGSWQTAYFAHAAFAAYLVLAPVVFFISLWAAHDAMQDAKEALMQQVSRQFNEDISVTYSELTGPANELKENLERVEQLKKLHQLTESFPVWPFDTQTIRQFILTMSSPLLAIVIPLLIDYLSSLIFPS
jgi:hypothetical protein